MDSTAKGSADNGPRGLMENVMARANAVVVVEEVLDTDKSVIGLTFKVPGEGQTSIRFANLSAGVRHGALVNGLRQRVSDKAAIPCDKVTGKSAPASAKFAAIKALAEWYDSGADSWTMERAAGGGSRGPSADTQFVIQAIAEIQGLGLVEMTERVKALCEKRGESVKAWADRMAISQGESGDRIRAKVLELKSKAAGSATEADDDLAELMGE